MNDKMKLLIRILFTIPILLFIIALWTIGIQKIITDVQSGHIPMYNMAIYFGVPGWFPLAFSIVCIIIFVIIILHQFLNEGEKNE